jgi:excisionase family DNA binding protein
MHDISPITLTVAEASHFLGVGEKAVRRLTNERRIPHIRVGKLIRFTRQGLEEYLREEQERSVEPVASYAPPPARAGSRRGHTMRGNVIRPVRL